MARCFAALYLGHTNHRIPPLGAESLLNSALSGRYQVEREIGAGGMATVYLARDVKHNRHVALKVLKPEVGAMLGAQRFLSEIRVTAKLQHPNLVPLFDSGDADGRLFYVMPYIAGESLHTRLAREKQLPIDETIRIATAIASALGYAHRTGVIHRDLKPENILLHEGQPLVADFGIALAISAAAGGERVTETGLSLGTPQYMSPEQATGDRGIDHRTDVYSLGALTYEMLTGDPPHSGNSAQAIIARVVTEHPRSIRSTRPTVPAHVEAAVMRALEKLPADRWQTALDYAAALSGRAPVSIPSGVRTPGVPRTPSVHTRRRPFSRPVPMILAGLAIGALLAALIMTQMNARADRSQPLTFVIDPPIANGTRQTMSDFALSPDGRIVAIVAGFDTTSQVFLRRLSDADASPIPGTDDASFAAFSPDGRWLGVTTLKGRLLKVPVDGSAPPMTIAEGVDWYSGLTWVGNETILLGSARPSRRGLGRIAATGGAVRPVTTATAAHAAHGFPYVTADGNTMFFTEWGPGFIEDDYLAIGSLETESFQTTSLRASRPIGDIGGRALYTVGTSIMAVPFDAKRLRVSGEPVRVVEDLSLSDLRTAALSKNGTLAYMRGQPSMRLVLRDRDGRTQVLSTGEHNMWTGGRFSPDGRRIAVDVWGPSGDTSTTDIWTLDVRARTFTPVTSLGNVVEPRWTSDGTALVFTTWFPRKAALWRQVVDRSAPAEKILEVPDGIGLFQANPTPDGKGVVFCQGPRFVAADPRAQLLYVPFDGGRTPERITDGEPIAIACSGSVSPDGRWLAYTATEGGWAQVFVRPFRRPGGRVQISEGNGLLPVWSRDGRRLFYSHFVSESRRSWVVSATVRAAGNAVEVVTREHIVPLPARSRVFDIAPDDERVLTAEPSDERVQLVVTTNWLSRLRSRL